MRELGLAEAGPAVDYTVQSYIKAGFRVGECCECVVDCMCVKNKNKHTNRHFLSMHVRLSSKCISNCVCTGFMLCAKKWSKS